MSNRAELREILYSRFDLEGVRSLAFDLNMEYEGLEKGELVRRVILNLEQHGKLDQLLVWLQQHRPDIDTAPFLAAAPLTTAHLRPPFADPPGEFMMGSSDAAGAPQVSAPAVPRPGAEPVKLFRPWMIVAVLLLVGGSLWLLSQSVGQTGSPTSTPGSPPAVALAGATSLPTAAIPTVTPASATSPPAGSPPAVALVGATSLPTVAAIPTVTATAQWTPQFQTEEGVAMALVPPGCFNMGPNPLLGAGSENPTTKICFDKPFWIDKTEVTQVQFDRMGGKAANTPRFAGDDRPVERITWFEARDFCALRGARLPTEAEWEYAARGPDNLIYPWGNTWDSDRVIWSGNSGSATADVGNGPAGASWVGTLDMSGNVWEWVSSLYQPYPYKADDGREDPGDRARQRVLRGGSWFSSIDFLRATYRNGGNPSGGDDALGFRCARSLR